MEIDEFYRLESYLRGELDASDHKKLEDDLEKNPTLRAQLEELKLTIESAEAYGLKQKLEDIHQQLYSDERKIKNLQLTYLISAAACISMLVAAWFFLIPDSTSPVESLYAQYVEVSPNYYTSRSSDKSSLNDAINHYQQGEYDDAILVFNSLSRDSSNLEDTRFYLGLSYLYNEKPEEAIKVLKNLLSVSSKYTQQIRWFLALSYLKNNDLEQSRQLLKNIKEKNYKFDEAQMLLDSFKKMKGE